MVCAKNMRNGTRRKKLSSVDVGKAWKELDASKRVKYRKEALSINRQGTDGGKGDKSSPKGVVEYYSRCVPHQIKKCIEVQPEMSPVRALATEFGFGLLCEVTCTHMPKGFILRLLEHFDPLMCELSVRGRQYTITVADVSQVMGIPNGSEQVPMDEK